MSKLVIRIVINILMALVVFGAWMQMFLRTDDGVLMSRGITSLRYFTTLSNIAEGFAALFFLYATFTHNNLILAEKIKFMACVCLGLTFMTIAFFLGPIYGLFSMYQGANFWFHLIVPLAGMAEAILLSGYRPEIMDTVMSVFPMLVYGLIYLANALLRGKEGNDWYGFLNWGLPIGIVIFASLCLATFLFALFMRFMNIKFCLIK